MMADYPHDSGRSQKQGLFCVDGKEYQFMIDLDDTVIGRSVFCGGEFDLQKVIVARQLIIQHGMSMPEVLVDVGANIGTICVPCISSGMFHKSLAVEPHPDNYRLLKANVVLNNLDGKITAFNVALGGECDGLLEMSLSEENSGDHRISASGASDGREKIQVRSTTLDTILEAALSDEEDLLVWMDTQGYEGWVLQGAEKILERRKPMVLEFWPYGMERLKSYEPLKQALLGYSGFYDLDNPSKFHSMEMLDGLYKQLGHDVDRFTDILVI